MLDDAVLVVDLDGTLILSDTLHESVIALLRAKPACLFAIPFWIARGRAAFKAKMVDLVQLDVTTLPYNDALIDWLRNERLAGRRLVLCSAANIRVANAVSDHLRLFDEVIASDTVTNLKSAAKREVLDKRFGDVGYDYVGNSHADIEVWAGAKQAVVVNARSTVQDKAAQVANIVRCFPKQPIAWKDWGSVLRVHQWTKNLLLFVPLLAAHQIGQIDSVLILLLAFVSFSLCASAVYIANDLLDLESDRHHPRKRSRPFAAGIVSSATGALLAPVLAVISLALGFLVAPVFFVCLLVYLVLTTAYSLIIKRIALIDCLILAGLYTIRVVAGAAAVSVALSFWLLAFSVFIFLSLAFVKRYTELQVHADAGVGNAPGRGYVVTDAPVVQTLGIASGYSSVLVFAFYLNSEAVTALYAEPVMIWIAVPLLLYWISWVWMQAHRGAMHDDPIVFAIEDKTSVVIAGLMIVTFLLAFFGFYGS